MSTKFQYGGMAVIEGVMMRGPEMTALAVRRPNGSIVVEKEQNSRLAARYPILKLPIIRGTFALLESLAVGIRMLNKSANLSVDEAEEELSAWDIIITTLVAFALAIALFVALPTAIVHWGRGYLGGVFAQNLYEGVIRIVLFLLYVYAISRMKDIKRVFMYHGAEHKTISTYEAGMELTPENVRLHSRFHPRCGTSFLLMVMIISIIVFAFLGDGSLFYRIWSRLAVFPIVAGLGYEVIKFSGRCADQPWARWLIAPGLWLQRLTTREPDTEMLEVAITSLRTVLAEVDQPEKANAIMKKLSQAATLG